MEAINLIDSFAEFKELKNIDRATLMRVLEDIPSAAAGQGGGADVPVLPGALSGGEKPAGVPEKPSGGVDWKISLLQCGADRFAGILPGAVPARAARVAGGEGLVAVCGGERGVPGV